MPSRDRAHRGTALTRHSAGILFANARGEAQHPRDHAPRKTLARRPAARAGTRDIQHVDPVSLHEAQDRLGRQRRRGIPGIDHEIGLPVPATQLPRERGPAGEAHPER